MKRLELHGQTKPGRNSSCVLLLILILFSALVSPATAQVSQHSRISTAAAPDPKPASSGASPAAQAAPQQPVTDNAPFYYLHLIAVLCSGLMISAARLARKFHRFWGLGVFTNPYALLFLLFGVVVCGLPLTSENTLKGVSFLGNAGPWIADFSGILAALVLPAIRSKPKKGPDGDSQVRDLEGGSSANPIWVIENCIEECILQRMQKEVVLARGLYDWGTIKLAAGRALEEEMTIRPLSNEVYDAVRLKIESFQSDPDPRQDSENKYKALLGLLRWCSFKRLLNGLNAAKRETEA
jgi:hypothetical protein